MAYPKQISAEMILETAVEMLKSQPEVDLRPLARKLGVQAPSLYRYFKSKESLQKGLAVEGYRRLGLALKAAISQKGSSLSSVGMAYRQFALANPRLYHLMHRPGHEPEEESPVADAVINPLAEYLGLNRHDESFIASFRSLRAYVHGFISLELSGQFSRPGNVLKSFEHGLNLMTSALEKGKRRAPK